MKRQDQLLAHMDAYAVDKETNAMLLQHEGENLSTSFKIVKSKLLAIDPTTKALLVKFGNQLPWQVLDPNPEFTTLKVGTGEDYLEISSSGNIRLIGDAKAIIHLHPQMQMEEIRKVNKPTGQNVGIYYTYIMPIYAADNEEIFFQERIPYRWDGKSHIGVHALVALSGFEPLPANFRFRLSWEFSDPQATDAALLITSHDTEKQVAVVADKTAQYSLYDLEFLIDYEIHGEIKSGDVIAMRLIRVAAIANEIANEMLFVDLTTHYHMDKLGLNAADEQSFH